MPFLREKARSLSPIYGALAIVNWSRAPWLAPPFLLFCDEKTMLDVPARDSATVFSPAAPLPFSSTAPLTKIKPVAFRTSALLETLAFLAILTLWNGFYGDGLRYFEARLHPFWIILLLITVQYGVAEALAAAFLCSAFLLVDNLPEQSLTETKYDYFARVLHLPFLWFLTALILGGLRTRQRRELEQVKERLESCEDSAQALFHNASALRKIKEQLELRIAEDQQSLPALLGIARNLETFKRGEARRGIEALVRALLRPAKFSLFLWDGQSLRLESACGWEAGDTYPRDYPRTSALVHTLLEKNAPLCAVQEEDEALLEGQGVLAGPLYDEKTGRIFGMLKIEAIGFMELTPHALAIFAGTCGWIARVYAHIEQHEEALALNAAPNAPSVFIPTTAQSAA